MLNNQPMGFYSAAVIVKDAQRHGLRVRSVYIQCSQPRCTIESGTGGTHTLRLGLGLNYVKGLRATAAQSIVREREARDVFRSTEDLVQRVPELNRKELLQLARIGALNWIGEVAHRREAMWQVEEASRPAGPLFSSSTARAERADSPLRQMRTEDRLTADYSGTGLTVGPHPMTYRRAQLASVGIVSAADLHKIAGGQRVMVADCVIARQRPGTALGFIFLSLEDETGIANIIVRPALYERDRAIVTRAKFLQVSGQLQNKDGVLHVRAESLASLKMHHYAVQSHDFH